MTAAVTYPTAQSRVAGDGLLNVVAIASIVVLIVNDHVLKAVWPGPITGKISDFAGLLFFPLFLQGVAEVASAVFGRWRQPSERTLLVVVGVTAAVFTAIKTFPAANEFASQALGLAQWLLGQLTMATAAAPQAVSIALDPTDLVALPMAAVAYVIGLRRCRKAAL
jgi:hypothetical protein